jgi:hypothetical protein
MTVLLRWMEPVEPGKPKRRSGTLDWIIGFAVAAVIGLGIVEKSGPTMPLTLGSGYELSMPAQAWQYGLWLLVTIAFGTFGAWIMSFGGRAEVTVREDGIGWLLGRALSEFHSYANMQRCELERADGDDYWRLRVTMKPGRPDESAKVIVLTMPRRVDRARVREILQSAGVVTAGWP